MTNNEAVARIAAITTMCPTCGEAPNAENFGGCCDPCNEARKARLARSMVVSRAYGTQNSDMGRALTHLGY